MKVPVPERRNSPPGPEPISEDSPIDITVPRECIHQRFEGRPGPCPRCGGRLQQSNQTYMVATRRGKKIADAFVMGNDMGWFCTRCPTVVINPDEVSDFLVHGLPHWDIGDEFVVLGVVDLDAVPEEKRDLQLGTDENPYPLIQFVNVGGQEPSSRPARQRKRAPRARPAPPQKKRKKRKRARSKKRRR